MTNTEGSGASPFWRTARAAGLFLSLALAFSGCGTAPKVPPKASEPSRIRLALIRDALALEGAPYRLGEAHPSRGFDCSGFVHYLYTRQGIRLPRTARAMAAALPEIPDLERAPGDLVFFNTTGDAYSHVGLFLGGNRFIHASGKGSGVKISKLAPPYWENRYLGTRSALLAEDAPAFQTEAEEGLDQ